MFLTDEGFIKKSDSTIRHGFFGRQGGVSSGIYDSLNCGLGSDDHPDHVIENRARVMRVLEKSSEALLTMHQTHSDICLTIDKAIEKPLQSDAMVTDVPGLTLGVLTADCAPVLFCGRKESGTPVIGAAHAGWKGAVGGILENTVKAMIALGTKDIKASIGPCLGLESFEVTEEFLQPFLAQDADNQRFFNQSDSLRFDLQSYVVHRLALADVQSSKDCAVDTYVGEDKFFSYRRSTHREEPDYGRQLSVIAIDQ